MSNNENFVKQDISELWKTNTDIKLIGEIVKFLQVFIPETLAKRLVALVLAIVGLHPSYISTLTGLSVRTIWSLRKSIEEGEEVNQIMTMSARSGRKRLVDGLDHQIIEEIENGNYHTRQQIADMIEEKYQIKLSLASVGRLLKKTDSSA